MPQNMYTLYMRKVESRQQGPPAKNAKQDEVSAAHCRADLVTECVKRTKTLILSGDFHFRLRPKMKNAFRSASSIHHKKVLVLKKRLDYITDRLQYTAPLSLARSEIMIGDITLVGRFPPLSPFISETVQDRSIFTMDH